MAKLVVAPEVSQKWDELTDKNAVINFYICEFTKGKPCKLQFFQDGKGGLEELYSAFKQNTNKALFAILKVVFYDDKNSPYIKFVFCKYVPSGVPVMTKGFLTPQLGNIEQAFPVKHLTYILGEELDKFDMKHISTDFDRVTENIVEIEYFEFGPNQTYRWAKKVMKPDINKKSNNNDDEKQNDYQQQEEEQEQEYQQEQEQEQEYQQEEQNDDDNNYQEQEQEEEEDDGGGY